MGDNTGVGGIYILHQIKHQTHQKEHLFYLYIYAISCFLRSGGQIRDDHQVKPDAGRIVEVEEEEAANANDTPLGSCSACYHFFNFNVYIGEPPAKRMRLNPTDGEKEEENETNENGDTDVVVTEP